MFAIARFYWAVLKILLKSGLNSRTARFWVENLDSLESNLRKALKIRFKVWRTIKLGGMRADEFLDTLQCAGRITEILKGDLIPLSLVEIKIDLVRISVRRLGFIHGAQYEEICAEALEQGLLLCPAEVGPQLRRQYPEQPRNEELLIATERILGVILRVVRYDNGTANLNNTGKTFFKPEEELIFALPS